MHLYGGGRARAPHHQSCSSSLLLSSLELSDANVYEPQIRALLGTASHFNDVPTPGATRTCTIHMFIKVYNTCI